MFAEAYRIASGYTFPVVISTRHYNGEVKCSIGAFIVINPEGWIVTAAHIFLSHLAFVEHKKVLESHQRELESIESNTSLSAKQKLRRKKRVRVDPKLIINHSQWWGMDGVRIDDVKVNPGNDIAVARLEPFDERSIKSYPKFKNQVDLPNGTSLCKLGFPLYQIETSFDESSGQFQLPEGALPIPRFPMEGILTRSLIRADRSTKKKYNYIETSSPGLKGQSGGPIFDAKGVVWGIQSHTIHHDLGFNVKVKKGNREIEECQFLNTGIGVHPAAIIDFLKKNKIDFEAID